MFQPIKIIEGPNGPLDGLIFLRIFVKKIYYNNLIYIKYKNDWEIYLRKTRKSFSAPNHDSNKVVTSNCILVVLVGLV